MKEDHFMLTAEVQQLKQQLDSTRDDYTRSKSKLRGPYCPDMSR
jgi:hypothetical protein